MKRETKQYTVEELCTLLAKFPRWGNVDIVLRAIVKGEDGEFYDFEGKVWLVDEHYLMGEIDVPKGDDIRFKIDLHQYVDIYCSEFGKEESDLIELWTQEQMNEEEQYAKGDSIAFMKTIPIHQLGL